MIDGTHPAAVLTVKRLEVAYGGIRAVKGIDLEVREHELVALIGANGAGKTTTMKVITGLLRSCGGQVLYRGIDACRTEAHVLMRHGLVMVPEGRGVFGRMTIIENMMMGAYTRRDKDGIRDDLGIMFDLFPRLKDRAAQLAGTLSGGEQQMLAMARAWMSRPRLLLLDEPSMGLSPIMVDKIFEVIRLFAAKGVPILLVEQNARLALEAADRAYVMESGEVSLQGPARKLMQDPAVRAAYLGA